MPLLLLALRTGCSVELYQTLMLHICGILESKNASICETSPGKELMTSRFPCCACSKQKSAVEVTKEVPVVYCFFGFSYLCDVK